MKTRIFFCILVVTFSISIFSFADIYDDISAAISSGNASQVSKYFSNNLDLTIAGQEEVYSKAQAEQILKDFFARNIPKNFSVIHQGISKEGAKYAIGKLVTSQGINYRVYFFIKQGSAGEFIQELRFDKE